MISIDPQDITDMMNTQKLKATKSLAGYKFLMFGYHAAQWVMLNKTLPRKFKQGNPFKGLVETARIAIKEGEV